MIVIILIITPHMSVCGLFYLSSHLYLTISSREHISQQSVSASSRNHRSCSPARLRHARANITRVFSITLRGGNVTETNSSPPHARWINTVI